MNTPASKVSDSFFRNPPDFSLVHGGPLFQLLLRAHLADDALELARKRIIVIALLAWLPLLLLSALEGQLIGGSVAVPFLMDVEIHIRFLVAIPLMVGAELVVHRRMRLLVRQFLDRNLIPEHAIPRFDAAIHSAFRLKELSYDEKIPDWDYKGTTHLEEMILVTQNFKEVQMIMSNYVGIVRSDLRLERAMTRLEIIYKETESLYKRSLISKKICELRNLINVGYIIIKMARSRHESIGLHYSIDYPKRSGSEF